METLYAVFPRQHYVTMETLLINTKQCKLPWKQDMMEFAGTYNDIYYLNTMQQLLKHTRNLHTEDGH